MSSPSLPLGVGSHVDHLVVCAAGLTVHEQGGNIVWYEDAPYAVEPDLVGQLQLRLAEEPVHVQGRAEHRQLLAELAKFPPKVRVLVVSASCHSGGLSAGPIDRLVLAIRKAFRALSKVMEGGVGLSADECKFDPKPHEIPTEFVNPPAMLFLTSCRSNEKSKDGRNLSLFTEKLRDVWNGGTFKGNYRDFINQVSAAVSDANDQQHPTCAWAGTFPGWHEHQPFRIMPPGP